MYSHSGVCSHLEESKKSTHNLSRENQRRDANPRATDPTAKGDFVGAFV